jgi:hypothetical protein
MEEAFRNKEHELKLLKESGHINVGSLGNDRPSYSLCSPHELPTQGTIGPSHRHIPSN